MNSFVGSFGWVSFKPPFADNYDLVEYRGARHSIAYEEIPGVAPDITHHGLGRFADRLQVGGITIHKSSALTRGFHSRALELSSARCLDETRRVLSDSLCPRDHCLPLGGTHSNGV